MQNWVSEQESLQKYGTPAYTGWGRAEADADARAKGLGGGGGGGAIQQGGGNFPSLNVGGMDIVSLARQLAQPATNVIQGAISDTKARYEQIRKEITGQAGQDVASEFGKRGIPTSSGIVQQAQGRESARRSTEMLEAEQSALNPLYQQLAGQSDMSGLLGQFLNAQSTAGAAAAGPSGWEQEYNSQFAQSTARPATVQATQPIKLNQANKPIISNINTSPLSGAQTAIFSALAPIQTGIQKVGSAIKKQVTQGGNPLLNLLSGFR